MEVWQSPVYCSSLENCRSRDGAVSSNLTTSTRLSRSMEEVYPSSLISWESQVRILPPQPDCRHSLMVKKRAYTSPKHRPDKPECAGSSPAGGTKIYAPVAERPNAADCKSVKP